VPSQWNTGFTANIVITNLGSPLTSWNLGYSYSGNQTLQSGWSGTAYGAAYKSHLASVG
jgi:cellulase/cellobiase CelA1